LLFRIFRRSFLTVRAKFSTVVFVWLLCID
jgi:hypothetical protein